MALFDSVPFVLYYLYLRVYDEKYVFRGNGIDRIMILCIVLCVLVISRIISDIYSVELPNRPSAHTTYNVGMIEGGTSINSIASSAKMLCEYRSDDIECLERMKLEFERIFDQAKARGVDVTVRKIGERPCKADVDKNIEKKIADSYKKALKAVFGLEVREGSGSTDANLPMSMGIASACIGVYSGEKLHTREEYLEKSSVAKGLEVGIKVALDIAT